MRLDFIHEIKIQGLTSSSGKKLLHDTGYYTLNEVPGEVLKSPQMTAAVKSGKNIVQPKRITKMPNDWNNKSDQKLMMGTKPGLKYDVEEVQVKKGPR